MYKNRPLPKECLFREVRKDIWEKLIIADPEEFRTRPTVHYVLDYLHQRDKLVVSVKLEHSISKNQMWEVGVCGEYINQLNLRAKVKPWAFEITVKRTNPSVVNCVNQILSKYLVKRNSYDNSSPDGGKS